MKKNVGKIDIALRLIIGVALLFFALTQGAWWGWIGIIPLGTALLGFCPLYTIFGLSSCSCKKEEAA